MMVLPDADKSETDECPDPVSDGVCGASGDALRSGVSVAASREKAGDADRSGGQAEPADPRPSAATAGDKENEPDRDKDDSARMTTATPSRPAMELDRDRLTMLRRSGTALRDGDAAPLSRDNEGCRGGGNGGSPITVGLGLEGWADRDGLMAGVAAPADAPLDVRGRCCPESRRRGGGASPVPGLALGLGLVEVAEPARMSAPPPATGESTCEGRRSPLLTMAGAMWE